MLQQLCKRGGADRWMFAMSVCEWIEGRSLWS